MKSLTDVVQGRRLSDIIPEHNAIWEYDSLGMEHIPKFSDKRGFMDIPAWTIDVLLKFLGKKFDVSLFMSDGCWTAIARGEAAATRQEPIDAVVDLILKLNEIGLL